MKTKQLMILIKSTIPKGYSLYNNSSTFVCPIYTFPWRKTKLLKRQINEQIGKSTLIILSIKGKMPTLAGNKHLSVHLFLHGTRSFLSFDRKKQGSNPTEMDIKVVTPALIITKTKSQGSLP